MTKTVPTLQDVANKAGVSKAVASRALSSEKKPISAAKKVLVLKAAEEIGYVANPFAKSLNSNTTGLVAIVVNHINDISDLELFDSLLEGLQKIGKLPVFIRLKSEDDIKRITNNSFVHRVDAALIFSDLLKPEKMSKLFHTPMVINLNGQNWPNTWSLLIDEEQGIKDAIGYAASKGISHAVLIGGRENSAIEALRIGYYQKYFKLNKITVVDFYHCDYSYTKAKSVPIQWDSLPEKCAIFCTSDSMAMAIVDTFITKKDTPMIIGFDNTLFSHFGAYQFPSIGYSTPKLIEILINVLTNTHTSKHQGILKISNNFVI
ncbi:LacI family transcriptional regulator [Vibrio sp.]|nr:LacI family transcriptional regulator [Vibrio sp.]